MGNAMTMNSREHSPIPCHQSFVLWKPRWMPGCVGDKHRSEPQLDDGDASRESGGVGPKGRWHMSWEQLEHTPAHTQ